jgi:hypothetical protein
MITEQTVLLTAVLWETFINDLVIAHVMQHPKSCLQKFEDRLRQSMSDKFGSASRWVSLQVPATLTTMQAEKLLDPKGWNLAAESAQGLADLANRHLSAARARRFSLQADDRDFVDFLISLRNYLSHRSAGSRTKFIDSVHGLKAGGLNDRLIGPVHNVSTYLKQGLVGDSTKVEIIGKRTIDISAKLV